jgi:hypothetical protein
MRRVPRRLAATAALAVGAAVLFGAPTQAAASPAQAAAPVAVAAPAAAPAAALAASCYIVCDDVNPNTAVYERSDGALVRCNGYRTVYAIPGVELRYSTSCRMAWARGNPYLAIKIESFNSNGSFRTSRSAAMCTVGPPVCAETVHTVALNDAGLTARACVFAPSYGWQCTARW